MFHILSKKEAINAEKEIDKFLVALDFNIKSGLVSLLKPILKERDCLHYWIDTSSYENDFPKNSLICQKCSSVRKGYKNGDHP